MKRLIALALAVLVAASLAGCGGASQSGDTAKTPSSGSDLQGENYEDVMAQLEAAGFTNIETRKIDDLITGWLTKDGEVEEVSIDGSTDFGAGRSYPSDARVVITYHTFPETESDEVETSEPAEEEAAESTASEADDVVLSAANSEELAAVLNAEDPGDPKIKAFTDKYSGRTIEFDGYTWDWVNHSSYSSFSGETKVYETLYDTNIYVGDVENANVSSVGPIFRAEEFSMPNFTPELNRMNVHVTARVGGYDADHQFFELSLISLEAR